jgi:hypothetical protein
VAATLAPSDSDPISAFRLFFFTMVAFGVSPLVLMLAGWQLARSTRWLESGT